MSSRTTDPRPGSLADALEGATGDYAVSGDAMRWSPDLVGDPPERPAAEVPAPLEGTGVRRLVTGAIATLTRGAGEVVTELRQLTRGGA